MKHLFAVIFILSFIASCGDSSSPFVATTPSPQELKISGSGNLGIFDPSITSDPTTGRLWMSYSSINTSGFYVSSTYWAVSIRLAYSDDNGRNWQDSGLVAANTETKVGPVSEPVIAANSQGIWQSETSTLMYDPSAPLNERWKLIWHQYLNANLVSYFVDYGWISLKMAATPEQLSSATAIKLFAGAGLRSDNNVTGAPIFSPNGSLPAIQLNTDITNVATGANLVDLKSCAFAEPGLHATNSALYLAVFCADLSTIPLTGKLTEYLVYFRCSSPCSDIAQASSWEYLGRLLTPEDALAATGSNYFQAPALVEKNKKTYLIVTPVNTSQDNKYNSCRVYEFVDLDSNLLRRNNGRLVEVERINGDKGTHNGACAAYAGLNGGILVSQFEGVGDGEFFKIFKSLESLP